MTNYCTKQLYRRLNFFLKLGAHGNVVLKVKISLWPWRDSIISYRYWNELFFVPVQFGQNWGFNSKPRSEKKNHNSFFSSKKVKITLVSECVTLLKHSCCQNIKLVRNIRVRRWEIHSCGKKWSTYGVCLDSAFGNTPPETNHVATFIRH